MNLPAYNHKTNNIVASDVAESVLCSRGDADRILLWAMAQGATPDQATASVSGVLMPRYLVDLYMAAVNEERKPIDYGYSNE